MLKILGAAQFGIVANKLDDASKRVNVKLKRKMREAGEIALREVYAQVRARYRRKTGNLHERGFKLRVDRGRGGRRPLAAIVSESPKGPHAHLLNAGYQGAGRGRTASRQGDWFMQAAEHRAFPRVARIVGSALDEV